MRTSLLAGRLSARAEFLDLWHSLKVPNDVDLLKQLANGTFLFPNIETRVRLAPSTIVRGLASHRGRSGGSQGTYEEEGQEECHSKPAGKDHQPSPERDWHRFDEGLCPSQQVGASQLTQIGPRPTAFIISSQFVLNSARVPSHLYTSCISQYNHIRSRHFCGYELSR